MHSNYLLPPGIYHPATTSSPKELFAPVAKLAGVGGRYVERLSGVESFRTASGLLPSQLAMEAIQNCISQSHIDPASIDMIIMGSVYKDCSEPATASLVSKRYSEIYDLPNPPKFLDVQNACNGVFSSIHIADSLIRSGSCKNVLVVSGETGDEAPRAAVKAIEEFVNSKNDPFGLGDALLDHIRHYAANFTLGSIGAATVVSSSPVDGALEIVGMNYETDASTADICMLHSQSDPLVVNPPALLEVAVPFAISTFTKFLRSKNNSVDSLDYLFVHQPALNTLNDYAVRLDYPIERIVETVTRFGNVITCSTLLGWSSVKNGIKPGQLIGTNIVGSGISSGSMLLRGV